MNKFEQLLSQFIKDLGNDEIYSIYTNIPAGKRVRPKLVFSIAGTTKQSLTLAVIIELIHIASLLHDDVIDDSDTRRGKISINSKYDNKTAIMMGDILYSKAFYELCSFDASVSQVVSNAVNLLSIGELEDVSLSTSFNTSKEAYLSMIYKKTASLIEASCISAALLTGKDTNAYALYGKNIGLAFQIIDDLLDITQSSEMLGKPNMSDFVEGKVTLPYLIAYENSSSATQKTLKSLFKKTLTSEENQWIKNLFTTTNAIEQSYIYAKDLASQGLSDITNKELHALMNKVISRNF